MITAIEDELYKIIQPVIQKTEVSVELSDCRINMDIIGSRDKINLINNLKTFIKTNLSNPALSIIFSKHISLIFSKILFQCLNNADQNVRIAADECINLIIKLTTLNFSPYIIYNLFIEIKNNESIRSLNGALQKFAVLSSLIKSSKKMSYINNVLPVLKLILSRTEESVSLTLVETLPRIAKNLFPHASDPDIEKSIIFILLECMKSSSVISYQRNIAQLISISCFHMKDRKKIVVKLLRYFLSIDYSFENEIRGSLFVQKYLITSCQTENDYFDLEEFALVMLRLIEIFDRDLSVSIKNLALDCLLQLLQIYKSSRLSRFLYSIDRSNYENLFENINHDSIFDFEQEKELEIKEIDNIPIDKESHIIEVKEKENIKLQKKEQSKLSLDKVKLDSIELNDESEIMDMEMFQFKSIFDRESVQLDDCYSMETVEEPYYSSLGLGNKNEDLVEDSITVESEITDKDLIIVERFGTISTWKSTTIEYLVKVLIFEFLPECVTTSSGLSSESKFQNKSVRVNSKVSAINCLAQICRIDYQLVLNEVSILDGEYFIPSTVECVLTYCANEDAQLSGSAIIVLAQVLHSHLSHCNYLIASQTPNTDIDCVKLINVIQSQINHPISGQHLKSVLSAVKLFIVDLISSDYGLLAIDLCESVLRYTDHNYKLVKKEVLLISQVIDFRNIKVLTTTDRGSGIIKKTTLANKFINAVLHLLTDIEQDIREDACESIQCLITNGAFDREICSYECSCLVYSHTTNVSLTSKSRLIPFLHQDISASLSDIRKKGQHKCRYHNTEDTVHRAVHIITERLISNPASSTKEMKLSLNQISGCIHALLSLHEKYPISTYSKVWVGIMIKNNNGQNTVVNTTTTETRTLIGYCLSLLNTSLIISDVYLHTDLLCLISKLIFHGGIKHLLLNNLIIDRTNHETGVNTKLNNNLSLVASTKQFMIHLCRIMNIYWHIFQFITPSIPPHKSVIPNLSSQTHVSPGKKKIDSGQSKGSLDSQSTIDSRPPRSKSCLGFFVNEPNYMLIHKVLTVAYNSYLISFDSSAHTDRLLNLLTQCLNSLSAILEFLTFSEVSMYIDELLSYCSIFYNILPTPTVNLIIKLLGSLFGTNLTAQWDPFLFNLFVQVFADGTHLNQLDIVTSIMESWKNDSVKNGQSLQTQLKNISISVDRNDISQIDTWKHSLSDIFLWTKASGKRREPGILRQIASINPLHRPSLSHYIGLFEKHVFQCMRQYLISSIELQTSIISLLCQLIYLRVNYCQLDSEQKFLNIILNQLENFTSYNIDDEKDAVLIIEITEFLILISYEKATGNRKDQPILNIAQVIRCIESLLINGVNVKNVIINCMWKIVCDLFVHRSVWMNNPGNFNLIPNANTLSEIEVQREAIIEFLLRKLIKYPETLEILALIIEHAAREQEMKWFKISNNIWSRLVFVLLDDSIEFLSTAHIDHLFNLFRLLPVKVLTQSPINKTIFDLALKVRNNFSDIQDKYSQNLLCSYQLHIKQAVRSVICFQMIYIHNINYTKDCRPSELLIDLVDEAATKCYLYNCMFNNFHLLLKFYIFTVNDQYLREIVDHEYLKMARKLMKTLLLIFIDYKITENPVGNNELYLDSPTRQELSEIISSIDNLFLYLPASDVDLYLLWNEYKLTYDIATHFQLILKSQSQISSHYLRYNPVLQCCKHIIKLDEPLFHDFIKELFSLNYIIFVNLSQHQHVIEILDVINKNKELSIHILDIFQQFSEKIFSDNLLSIKWIDMIRNIHFQATFQLITLLMESIIARSHDFSVIVLMKVENLICSRLDMLLGPSFDVASNLSVFEKIKSLKLFINNKSMPISTLKQKFEKIENIFDDYITSSRNESALVTDPLDRRKTYSNDFDEKKFWKFCVEKSLRNHDQDIRLGPRLLQGGSQSDLEQIFCIKITSDEQPSTPKNCERNDIVSNLPPRFVQQCLRLGFLRSGGGVVQEGVRVDIIFRLGEKLVFEELRYILQEIKECLAKQDFYKLSLSILIGLVGALNNYLSLSCQLSVPIPVSIDTIKMLNCLIESLCILITRSNKLRSRILIEELLILITSCYGSSSLLTDEGIKFMGDNLTLSNVSIIVDFIDLLVDQFSSNRFRGSMKYSLPKGGEFKNSVRSLFILDKILKCYYLGQMEESETELQRKLRLAVISIARLPCVVMFTRNPKNIKECDWFELEKSVQNFHKNVLELDCLSKMNRDDLNFAQTILNSLGWTSRRMFEESWLLFLNLLHDKGPSTTLNEGNSVKTNISAEEVVEQGHCDSLGLLGLTNMIFQTTARPNPGNPVVAQFEHKTRDKTPNLLHTKTGRKLYSIHAQLEEEIFNCHRGFKMLTAGWIITSWNLEREDSILKYRHDQININVIAKRISIGSRSPQISGSNSNNIDVLSCLQSLPIICQQWLECIDENDKRKSVALWPRICALRSAVILLDLFSTREQVKWLLESLLELYKFITIEDDWITISWICIGLAKCVAVLETSSSATLPQNASGKPPNAIPTNTIYGLAQSLKLIESCLNSDITILQQSALYSSMCLLQMVVFGKNTWDLPVGSLLELKNLHDMVMRYLENQLLIVDNNTLSLERRASLSDSFNFNSNALSQVVSSGAATIANTVSGFPTMNSVNAQLGLMTVGHSVSLSYFSSNSLPRLLRSSQIPCLRTERHNYLVMAAACFYCERYPDALSESDILNSFVTLAKNIVQNDKKRDLSSPLLLTMCRCLERILLTQRVSIIVTEQIIRLCGQFLKTCKSTNYSLPVLGLFLTCCYLSLANSSGIGTAPASFETVFYNGPSHFNGENQLVMLERINLFWKRLTDSETMDVIESRILSRLISNIMTDFMSNEELLNKTIDQLLRSWPRSQCVAKTLFDIINKCLNQPGGEKLIRKWTLLVLQSLTSCRPVNLSIWATTIVLLASGSSSRSCLRALFSQCLDWLMHFERGDENPSELEISLCLAASAFLQDITRDPITESDNKSIFLNAMQANSNIPAFQKFLTLVREKHLS